MQRVLLSILSLAALAAACSDGRAPILATAPSPSVTPALVPTPFAFAEPYTRISVGDVVTKRGSTADSQCIELPGWYCHYFRLTAPSDGGIDIQLTWVLATQPVQPLDLSLTDATGRTSWSEYGAGPQGHLRALLAAGSTYQITVWYTFPGVEFELRSSPAAD